jgi:chromosome segregation ATPase
MMRLCLDHKTRFTHEAMRQACDIIDQQAAEIDQLSEQANEIGGINLQLNKKLKAKEEIIDELEADRRDLQLIIITKNGELKAKDEELLEAKKMIMRKNGEIKKQHRETERLQADLKAKDEEIAKLREIAQEAISAIDTFDLPSKKRYVQRLEQDLGDNK